MSEPDGGTTDRIENRTFDSVLTAPAAGTTPASHGLFSPCFNLSEADFMRLQSSSPVLMAVGGVTIAFALSNGLPLVAAYLLDPAGHPFPGTLTVVSVVVAPLAVGLICLIVGRLYSRERYKLVKRIRATFAENEPKVEYRGTIP